MFFIPLVDYMTGKFFCVIFLNIFLSFLPFLEIVTNYAHGYDYAKLLSL